jgi:hypothetical protein
VTDYAVLLPGWNPALCQNRQQGNRSNSSHRGKVTWENLSSGSTEGVPPLATFTVASTPGRGDGRRDGEGGRGSGECMLSGHLLVTRVGVDCRQRFDLAVRVVGHVDHLCGEGTMVPHGARRPPCGVVGRPRYLARRCRSSESPSCDMAN